MQQDSGQQTYLQKESSKMKLIKKISVGIIAYNEQENLEFLIQSLFNQKISSQNNLVEIIVISDGSCDSTVEIAKSFRDRRIILAKGRSRLGKNKRLNRLFKVFKGEVLILLDADVIIKDENTIEEIVKPFKSNKRVGLVAGNPQPLPAKTLVESSINNFIFALSNVRKNIKGGENIYGVRGPIMALSKNFAKSINIPENVPDDRFIYFMCKKLNFKFRFVEKASVLYRSPQTIKDQILQGSRWLKDKNNLKKLFDEKYFNSEYLIPFHLRIKMMFIQIRKNPLGYILMKYIHLKSLRAINKQQWEVTFSTNKLN